MPEDGRVESQRPSLASGSCVPNLPVLFYLGTLTLRIPLSILGPAHFLLLTQALWTKVPHSQASVLV